jgi:serine/threonine protein kinase
MTDERNNSDNGQHGDRQRESVQHDSGDGLDTAGQDLGHDLVQNTEDLEHENSEPEDRLLALASRIDQGHPIDWDAAERDARDDRERAVISELRLLADVARVGREDSLAAEAGPEPFLSSLPSTWGSLTILEPIGRGAFATVYRARDNLGRLVALKLFSLPRENATDWAARLLHEGRLLARLKHENVVTIHGADQCEGYVGLWMEFVRGRTLEEELTARGLFSADEAVHAGRVLCRALAAVHHAGLLHRDVKAHNVMREDGGRIVLMDFGSGRDVRAALASPSLDLAGTPLYLAPEVFAGRAATIASDIYSLGVLLYHLVSGRYPVEGANRSEIQRAHAERRRTWLRDARPDLPDAFVRVIERALASDPDQRYQTAGELDEALAGGNIQPSAASSGGSSPPVRTSAPISEDVSKPPSRYRWQTIVAGTAFALATALIVALLPMAFRPTPHASDPPASSARQASPPPSATPVPSTSTASGPEASAYDVQATFYKRDNQGQEVLLASGDRVIPGDRLGLRVQTSQPAYVYVANQDEQDNAYLLYPLQPQRGHESAGPLPAERVHHLPEDESDGSLWQVTSPGVREHFLVFVSRTMLTDFQKVLEQLPRPVEGQRVMSAPIPKSMIQIGQTRGVGGLAKGARVPSSGLRQLFEKAKPLKAQTETTDGAWIRELTLVNPVTRTRTGPTR